MKRGIDPNRVCIKCAGPVTTQSKSGACKRCSASVSASPEVAAKISASLKRYFTDPEARQRAKETVIRNGQTEYAMKRRSEVAKRIGLSKMGLAAITPEIMRKRAERQSAVALAHIPRELRDEYKRLRKVKKFTAAEAEKVIMDQHEADMARWRKEIAA